MIQVATAKEHEAGANYLVHYGGRSYPVDTVEQVWKRIGMAPFGWPYEVSSPVGLETSEFVPF